MVWARDRQVVRPLGSRNAVLESGRLLTLPVGHNHRLTFCDGDNQCLKRIAPDPVLDQALSFLRASSAIDAASGTGAAA